MNDTVRMLPGDVYCPFCLGEPLDMLVTDGNLFWSCVGQPGCGRQEFQHPYDADADGRFTWVWSDKYPKPNPGCPWCGSCNIRGVFVESRGDAQFICRRESCRTMWRGEWVRQGSSDNWQADRWKIHVPVESVPWASGTWADLECARRFPAQFWEDHSDAFPACCRWPKSCSAFDPGFTVGKGPTTLPVVWFDGFGWRSGPPDPKTIPNHLFSGMQIRWAQRRFQGLLPTTPPEEANDDEHDDCPHCGTGPCTEACD